MRLGVVVPALALAATVSAGDVADLSARAPGVAWDEKSKVVIDVTCDGKPDTAIVGYDKDKVWLGVVSGSGALARVETFQFFVGKHSQDSFCESPVKIETYPISCTYEEDQPLPGCKKVKGCSELSLVDGACDSFHFYWNNERKALMWWRA